MAMRVTRDALAVGTPMWMLGDSAYDIRLARPPAGRRGRPIAPYNPRNTDNPLTLSTGLKTRLRKTARMYS